MPLMLLRTTTVNQGTVIVKMNEGRCTVFILIAASITITVCAGSSTKCSTGAACFPNGIVPNGVTNRDPAYYCCLDKYRVLQQNKLPDGTLNCTCMPYIVDSEVQYWAQTTQGRMCNRDEDCQTSGSNSSNTLFTVCCRFGAHNNTRMITQTFDNVDYIGCRCVHQLVPSPDPAAYIVPSSDTYPSTGESCSYDKACQDRPSLKCQSSAVTFCCYGSLGIVTQNDGEHLTRCTCTNQVFGKHCEANPVAIRDTITHGTECTTGAACFPNRRLPLGITDRDPSYYCCLAKNMTRHQSTQPDGTQKCTCMADFTLDSQIQLWADQSKYKGRMCNREEDCDGSSSTTTVEGRFRYCCWKGGSHSNAGIYWDVQTVDRDKVEYIGCRCNQQPVPTPDPSAYRVPSAWTYKSSGEPCSYDAGCQDHPSLKCQSSAVTFCCYGSRGIVTVNEGSYMTRCTCTNEVFGEHCEAKPVAIRNTMMRCEIDCGGKPNEEKCFNAYHNTRCCSNNMAVITELYEGSFRSCTCNAHGQKHCDGQTSSSDPHAGWRHSDVILIVLAALCSGQNVL